jgi:hypothetical protein
MATRIRKKSDILRLKDRQNHWVLYDFSRLSPQERIVLNRLSKGPVLIEELVSKCFISNPSQCFSGLEEKNIEIDRKRLTVKRKGRRSVRITQFFFKGVTNG